MFQSKTTAKLLSALAGTLAALALLAPGASAAEPAPGYGQFSACPSPAENPAVAACFRSEITGGHFKMGSKSVPISKPMSLEGGFDAEFNKMYFKPGGGLTPVKQLVPGGLIGWTGLDWLVNFLGVEALKLYAVTELAGTPFGGDGINLPVKIHLINPVIGNSCYIGSNANPINLHLITGETTPPPPNKPIKGKIPTFEFDELGIIHNEDGIYVDNAFGVPGATGCTIKLFGLLPINMNPLVNLQAGLPAAAGTNETVQNFRAEFAFASLVYP